MPGLVGVGWFEIFFWLDVIFCLFEWKPRKISRIFRDALLVVEI